MTQFAETLKKLRTELDMSMQALADKAGVSKSMISKIERDDVQPTIDIAARLAKALGKTLSELLHTPQTAQIVFLPRADQAVWEDGAGIKRRNISPVFEGLKTEWLEVTLPPGTSIDKCINTGVKGGAKYVLVKSGILKIIVSAEEYMLKAGDSLYFDSNLAQEYHNESNEIVEYFVVMNHVNG
jgi:transcriptional regulator with XRE-family HTH domain